MTEYFQRRLSSALPVSPWLWWTSLFLLLALGPTSVVLSQDGANPGQYFRTLGDSVADADESQSGPAYGDAFTGRSGQAFGALFRGGYVSGPSFGRDKGLAPIELMPYFFVDQSLIFGDLRGFRGDNGRYGANMGLGFRQYVEGWDKILGVNFFNDYDDTSGVLFRQMGFGAELYGERFDLRGNAYFPYGDQFKLLNTQLVSNSQRFSGHNLLYDIKNTFGTTLKGMDAEIGIPLPMPVARRHDLRVYAGGYHYESESTGAFNGWSGRLQGNIIPSLQVQLQLTHDPVFDTNVAFSVAWSYGGYRQPDEEPKNQFNRMTTPVQRQYNISVARIDTFVRGNLAINPANGLPFFFDHVASYAAPGGNGTVELPFQTIDQTNPNVAEDIVFVHANSVFSGDLDGNGVFDNVVTLQSNVRFLGEGQINGVDVLHTINAQGIGLIPLPRATNFPNRPLFINGIGDGVTLASRSEFSGFVVGDPGTPGSGPTGNGVFGTGGVNNVRISQTDINFAGLDGMLFDNAGGSIIIPNSRIFNPTGTALHVRNGMPGIIFSGDGIPDTGDITNTGAPALVVEDTLVGSSVNLTGADILNTGSATHGIFIDNVFGAVTVDQATINNAGTFGVQILDSGGNFTFRGDLLIGNPTDDAINITNLLAGGSANFTTQGGVAINNRNAAGINLVNISGAAQFFGDVNIGAFAGGVDPGINWQDSSGSVLFNNIAINGSGGDGIDLGVNGANSGIFRVTNTPVINGLITNVALNIQNNTLSSQIFFNTGVDVAGRGNGGLNSDGSGIVVLDNAGQVQFGGLATVANPQNRVNPAVDIRRNTGNVRFNNLTITGATSGGTDGYGAGMNVQDNPALVTVQGFLDITAANGIGLFVLDSGNTAVPSGGIDISDGAILTSGLPAVDIENSVMKVQLTSVDDTRSIRQGIRLQDNVGTGGTFDFAVTGDAGGLGSGGTITASTLAGVRAANTGRVSLANMILSTNLFGVHSLTTERIQLADMQLLNNRQYGLLSEDTQFVDVETSLFNGNGGAGLFNEIHIEVQTPDDPIDLDDDYDIRLVGNDITDRGDDAVFITTTVTGAGAHANLLVSGNTISTTAQLLAGTTVDWSGTIDAQFDRNVYNLTAGGNAGINFITSSALTTDDANLRILTNDFEGAVGANTAILIDAAANINVDIGTLPGEAVGNIINLTGAAVPVGGGLFVVNTGIRFLQLGPNANHSVRIRDTLAFDDTLGSGFVGTIDGDGGTAIVFDSVRAPNTIEISNNRFDITGPNLGVREQGIIFTSVIGGSIDVSSQQNNVITFPNTNFFDTFLPLNATNFNGTITVNGQPRP